MNILGIDVGGSGIKGAIVNIKTGQLVGERLRIPTPSPAKPSNVANVIQEIVRHFDWKGPIGCGFPTVIEQGRSTSLGNLHKDWFGVRVDKIIGKAINLPITVINDADAAGLAEIKFGAGKNIKGVVMVVTIGTGIGTSVFFNGQLIPNTELGRMFWKNGDIIEKYVADSVRKEHGLSYEDWGKRLNKILLHMNLVLPPDLFIIGGGISNKIDKYQKYLTIKKTVVPAQTLNEAGIIGAALAAYKGKKKIKKLKK